MANSRAGLRTRWLKHSLLRAVNEDHLLREGGKRLDGSRLQCCSFRAPRIMHTRGSKRGLHVLILESVSETHVLLSVWLAGSFLE